MDDNGRNPRAIREKVADARIVTSSTLSSLDSHRAGVRL